MKQYNLQLKSETIYSKISLKDRLQPENVLSTINALAYFVNGIIGEGKKFY
jgi:hypothetical protein